MSVLVGDCRAILPTLPERSVQTVVTSPPYYSLRDYGIAGQIGLEATVDGYVAALVDVFRLVRRVLADDGTVWLNLGDSYTSGGRTSYDDDDKLPARAGSHRAPSPPSLKPKDLVGIPWRVAFALQADGWYLRNDIIWHKPNPMPESVTDRCTRAHEYVFHLAKSGRYYFDGDAIKEPGEVRVYGDDKIKRVRNVGGRSDGFTGTIGGYGLGHHGTRNKRTVWTVTPKPFPGAHFAVMPPDLVEPCIRAGSRAGDTVLDPFAGAGTVGLVAARLGRRFVGIELNPDYAAMAEERIRMDAPLLHAVAD